MKKAAAEPYHDIDFTHKIVHYYRMPGWPLKTMGLTMMVGFVTMNSCTLKSSAKLRTQKPSLSDLLSAKLRVSESYTAKGAGVSARASPAFGSVTARSAR